MKRPLSFGQRQEGRSLFGGLYLLLLLKLQWMRMELFGGIEPLALAADALSLLALLGLLELATPRRGKGPAYWAFNLVFSGLLFAVTLYFKNFGTVATYTALGNLGQVLGVRESVEGTIRPLDYVYFADLAVIAAVWALRRRRGSAPRGRRSLFKPLAAALCLAGAAGSLWFVREAEATKSELAQAESVGLFNYQIVSALKSYEEEKEIASGNIAETIEAAKALQASYPYGGAGGNAGATPQAFGAMRDMNLIVVQLEALQNFPIRLKLGEQEVTPVLNRLADEGWYAPHFFQQIGQGNTSDAEFIANTSIYPTGTIAMSTGYGNRKLPSLPRLLQERGYRAYTFHINNVGFWDRNKLYPALGFDKYYDKPYFHNDHFNSFGASDEELYRTAVDELAKTAAQGGKFYAHLITTSNHSPFRIPEDKQTLTLPDGLRGTVVGDYLQSVHYTDWAVGRLIDGLKEKGLWDRTALVLYGDHFGLQPQDADPELIRKQLGIDYDKRVSRLNIPLVIRYPGQQPRTIERTGGQMDLLPTIANLLGIRPEDGGVLPFGRDLLNTERNVIGMRYYLPTGSFLNDDILFVPGKGFEDGEAIRLDTLQPVADFSAYRDDYEYMLKLMALSDQYVKLLPKR
ncbi:LTA synthase family protein [Paenibacillus sp. FSL W8-1187]|uniref:LTA synthase family protein n=1 Tax=unclassified Paenibacillus TaxID=185978 RepID=UPI00129B177B|nr:LTA synthase family protein [Paenibacillus sp. B01]QGG56527.1 sulfatase-like hydrolase/transferase [Paenibacillus sp. B01]